MKKKLALISLFSLCLILLLTSAYSIYKNKIALARELTTGQQFIKNLTINNDKNSILPTDLSINFKKKNLNITTLSKYNRIYVELKGYLNGVSERFIDSNNKIIIGDTELNLDEKVICKNDEKIPFRGDVITYKGKKYLSLIDINEALGYYARFCYEKKTISVMNGKKLLKDTEIVKERYDMFTKAAYIRLEDFTAGSTYTKAGEFEKIRVVSELLHNENQQFHVAWVPRYVNPEKGIDNDLLSVTNYSNMDFMYTLDYMINKGAIVGLHGYTHQYGNEESITGSEFGEDRYKTEEDIRSRAEKAILTAIALNIPYTFWESPHYRITKNQQLILEEYFDYMYEPSHVAYNKDVYVGANGITKYIPTPLSYVKDKDVNAMMEAMNSKDKNEALSFFYHVAKESDYIAISDNEETLDATYSDNSILKKLIKHAHDLGYSFKPINRKH